jgi:hypothetical protein
MAVVLPESLEAEIHEAADRQGIGVSEFVVAAVQLALTEYRERQIAAEAKAWYALSPDLRQSYAGRYVAVYQGKVVDADLDQRSLLVRVQQQFGRVPVMITEGGDHPVPVYAIRSPRLVRLNDGD